jgi:hypothetical protein
MLFFFTKSSTGVAEIVNWSCQNRQLELRKSSTLVVKFVNKSCQIRQLTPPYLLALSHFPSISIFLFLFFVKKNNIMSIFMLNCHFKKRKAVMIDPHDTKTVDIEAALAMFKSLTRAAEGVEGKEVQVFAGRKKESVSEPFVLLFYESLSELVLNDRLTMTDMKVMLGICGLARFGNMVALSQGGLADALGLNKSAVSRSIKKLTEESILLKTKMGLFINPTLIVKGGLSNVEPNLWDEALLAGSISPVKSVARKQKTTEKKSQPGADEFELF